MKACFYFICIFVYMYVCVTIRVRMSDPPHLRPSPVPKKIFKFWLLIVKLRTNNESDKFRVPLFIVKMYSSLLRAVSGVLRIVNCLATFRFLYSRKILLKNFILMPYFYTVKEEFLFIFSNFVSQILMLFQNTFNLILEYFYRQRNKNLCLVKIE